MTTNTLQTGSRPRYAKLLGNVVDNRPLGRKPWHALQRGAQRAFHSGAMEAKARSEMLPEGTSPQLGKREEVWRRIGFGFQEPQSAAVQLPLLVNGSHLLHHMLLGAARRGLCKVVKQAAAALANQLEQAVRLRQRWVRVHVLAGR